tara:strand:+ start:4509 stop:5309 length:801 start_codon:yes stop_codon:yes gene_type:complete
MKTKIYFIFSLLIFVLVFNTSCEESNSTFNTFDSATLLSFGQAEFEISVPQEDFTLEVPVTVSTLASSARTFNAVVESATEGTENEYSVGTVLIPANEYSGTLSVDFDFSEIGGMDGEVKEVVVALNAPDDVISYNDEVTINYFREIVCNDLELTIISDTWATETYFTLEQADGTVIVERFFPFSANSNSPQTYNVQFTLADGDYVFKLGDVFGDGQVSSALTGSYSLVCSIITHASGDGALISTPDPFPGAPNATVEVTEFSVNP